MESVGVVGNGREKGLMHAAQFVGTQVDTYVCTRFLAERIIGSTGGK